jgi:hypothetical protein
MPEFHIHERRLIIEEWRDVETRHYLLLNDGAAVLKTAPGRREHNYETGDGDNNVLHNQGEARVDAHKAAMALPRSLAIYDPVDVEEKYFHAAPWNETRRSENLSAAGNPRDPRTSRTEHARAVCGPPLDMD